MYKNNIDIQKITKNKTKCLWPIHKSLQILAGYLHLVWIDIS